MFSIKNAALAGVFTASLMAGTALSCAQSMQSVVEAAVARHPEVLALAANRKAIGEELNAARGLALPGVNVEAAKGIYDDDNTHQNYREWSIKLRQPILDGGKAWSETTRQTERVNSARNRVADTANTIGLQVVQASLEVLRARMVADIARKNLKTIKGIVGRVDRRVKGGGATKADLEQARSRLFAAHNSEAEASINLMDAEALYLTITGTKPGKLGMIKLPAGNLPGSIEQAVEMAMDASPKILAMQSDAAAAEAAIGTAKSAIMPTLDLELSANHRDRIVGTSAANTNYKAMVVFRMSLYNGGINAARIKEAGYRAEEAQNMVEATRINVEREIRLAWNAYKGAPQKVGALKNQASANRSTLSLRLAQYDSGQSSLISILDAQNEALVSEVQAINEDFGGRFSFYKILAASGRLLDALHVSLPAEAI